MTSGPVPGNETARQHYRYDAWNRLVKVTDDSETPVTIAEYLYGGSGRRIAKLVPAGEDWNRTDYLYNEEGQVLEERTGTFESLEGTGGARTTVAETPAVQYLWDIRYSDAPVLRWRDADNDENHTLEETLYYCQDANWNTTALVDAASGHVVERYLYDPYGKVTVLNGETGYDAGSGEGEAAEWSSDADNTSDWGNQVIFAGYGLDVESGLYHTDYREYDCCLGRFIQADPIGLAAGPNVYAYCDGWPTGATDPTGLEPDWGKVISGIFAAGFGALEVYASQPANTYGSKALYWKGAGDVLLGVAKAAEGLAGQPGLGGPETTVQAAGDIMSLAQTGGLTQEFRDSADRADFVGSIVLGPGRWVFNKAAGLLGRLKPPSVAPRVSTPKPVAPTGTANPTLKPGPYAGESIPARSPTRIFTPAEVVHRD